MAEAITSTSVLQVSDLSVKLPTGKGSNMLNLVNDINFELKAGQILGLVGESGSGKTVTCSTLLQLQDPSVVVSGSIKLNGRELNGLKEKAMQSIRGKDLGFIMQNPMNALTPVYTIGSQFVQTIRTHSNLTKRQAFDLAVDSLASVNLPDPQKLMGKYPFQLSGGMLQRVMIAMAISLKPSVVIADEPTTALDMINQLQVLKQLEQLRANYGTAILLITHDLSVIAELADEVMVICKGNIVEKASVYQLFDQPRHTYTRKLLGTRLDNSRHQDYVEDVIVNL
ncbi:ABC transporter ATP-binding protein [Paenibacillus sp. L3-i20]|uniref:ABC transporter ATP-binding protein n=1 Tax=Paenibacillus sp. L3-i20 TaxID=2905833 RepID=UPI001EDE4B7F|nr:ABC transporter ATP-binding protein [Paenibacillus sp. L3-i20]